MSQALPWLKEQLIAKRPEVSCLLFAAATLPILCMFLALNAYALHDQAVASLYRQPVLWGAQALLIALILGLVAVGIHGWRARDDEKLCTWLPMLTTTPTVVALVVLGIAHGLKDTPMSVIILAAFVTGRALFDLRTMGPSLLISFLLVVNNEVLITMGILPYAPLLTHPVFDGGPLLTWWSVWVRVVFDAGALPFSALVFFLFGTLGKSRRELESLVRTDMLTGLANRRTFMTQLEIESHRHARNKRPFCLIMCDVDHFKKINDTWGHPAGDAVLVELGRILKRTTREQVDTAARIGGEEFAVLMPETDLSKAQQMAEAMSVGVRSKIFVFDGEQVTVTQSVGIAQASSAEGQEALRLADDNLYKAKRAGRDRIVASVMADDA